MPDTRRHRSAAPRDHELFSGRRLGDLGTAVEHVSFLLGRGYAPRSTLKLVGDRFALTTRQRLAVMRCACSDEARRRREATRVRRLEGARVLIDGYNVLTTVESALAGGVVMNARDGCYRDLASLHGTWRRVAETGPAIELVRDVLTEGGVADVTWLLDRPVSNSGRLKAQVEAAAPVRTIGWRVELVPDPDPILKERGADRVVATADSVVLDAGPSWFNLAREVVGSRVPSAWIVDLSGDPRASATDEEHEAPSRDGESTPP